jgi:hypothetical protein
MYAATVTLILANGAPMVQFYNKGRDKSLSGVLLKMMLIEFSAARAFMSKTKKQSSE